jgi:polyisoprenoid-binding protein YceI
MTAAVAELTTGTWAIDTVHSFITYTVRHLGVGKSRGAFRDFSGAVVVAADGTPSVRAEIAIGSLDTGNEQRNAHLLSAEFFDAEQYPTASFVSTGVRPQGDGYVLVGDFTLRGVTKQLELELTFNGVSEGMGHGEVAGFDASVVFNRKDFGVAAEVGPLVGENVTITLEIETLKQP